MSGTASSQSEHDAITRTVQHYIDGARSGKSEDMKPAFHADAWIFGYGATGLLASPIQELFNRVDAGQPAPDMTAEIARIDVGDTVATVRLELDKWTGRRFTDFFTLLKVDGEWKIMNKVFHLHA